jgi:hypothetical protein
VFAAFTREVVCSDSVEVMDVSWNHATKVTAARRTISYCSKCDVLESSPLVTISHDKNPGHMCYHLCSGSVAGLQLSDRTSLPYSEGENQQKMSPKGC